MVGNELLFAASLFGPDVLKTLTFYRVGFPRITEESWHGKAYCRRLGPFSRRSPGDIRRLLPAVYLLEIEVCGSEGVAI